MSHNFVLTGVIAFMALTIGVAGGFFMAAQKYALTPYNGVGSTVLQSGTIIKLKPGEQYNKPSDIVGHIKGLAGTWVLEEK